MERDTTVRLKQLTDLSEIAADWEFGFAGSVLDSFLRRLAEHYDVIGHPLPVTIVRLLFQICG